VELQVTRSIDVAIDIMITDRVVDVGWKK